MAFKRLDPEDFVVSSDSITSTLWSNGNPELNTFFTSSAQKISTSGEYYLSIFEADTLIDPSTPTQFDIVYCDALGSGSEWFNNIVSGSSPTKTMYGQYRSMILEDETAQFTFGVGTNITSSDHFWALSIERSCYKESLFPGSLNLKLTSGGNTRQFTDNSQETLVNTYLGSTRVFQLISGSNGSSWDGNGGYSTSNGSYGLVFPDLGTILLNPHALTETFGSSITPSRASNTNGNNNQLLFNTIKTGAKFSLNSEETITSDYIFVRARNSEFNYSENSSFISGSTGEVIYNNFINHPQVYITTVGMYNDSNELVAVAKLSKPLLKDFTKECLLRVKLDF
jgi:hypothetical protein